MNNEKLNEIFHALSQQVEGNKGHWRFTIKDTLCICLTDELHNRMRIISPILKVEEISQDQIAKCMQANFHTALDVRYAISENVLWSAFIHPLHELTKDQVVNAVSQVYSSAKTFGTTYSSGALNFLTNEDRNAMNN